MRRIALVLVGLILFWPAGPTEAGARPDKEWKDVFGHFSAGIMLPEGDLDGIIEGATWINGGVLYWPSDWAVGLEIDLGYVSSDFEESVIRSINDQLMPGQGSITGGDVDMWSTSANLVWGPDTSGSVGFYLIGGVGFDFIDAKLTDDALIYYPPICDPWFWWCIPGGVGPGTVAVFQRDTTEFGWNAGVGLTFETKSGSEIFLEARYKSYDTSPHSTEILPVTVGVRW